MRLARSGIAAGETIVRVPPKMMAHARDSARTYDKSDTIDALAITRAAMREDDLPTKRLDGPDRDLRLLVDHREFLVRERNRLISRLRWHLHKLGPAWEPPARGLDPASAFDTVDRRPTGTCLVTRLARSLNARAPTLSANLG
ncbi:MAG: IS110 family transposase [Sporichthyaceae bacterium]